MYDAFDIDFTAPPAYRRACTDFSVVTAVIICEDRAIDVDVATMGARRLAVPIAVARHESAPLWFWAGALIVFACALGGLSFVFEIPLAEQVAPTVGFLGIVLLIVGMESGAG